MKRKTKMQKERKANETPLGCLSYDLIFEILSKLPLASVCKCKCVSKAWCSLIKGADFGYKFRSETSFEPFQLVFGSWGDPNVEIYSIDPQRGFSRLLEKHHLEHEPYEIKFCDGLICYTVRSSSVVYIYNPTTKQHVDLPLANFMHNKPPSFGFGFDPSSNKYKVLCWMASYSKFSEFKVIGLSLGGVDSVWSSLQIPSNIGLFRGEPVLASGSLFWFKKGDIKITLFNLATEKFSMIALPSNMNCFFTHTLFVSQDILYLAEQPEPRRPLGDESLCHLTIVNMWMLKKTANNVWIRLMSDITLPMEGTTLEDYYFCYGSISAPHNARFAIGNGEIVVLANDHRHHYLFVYCFLSGFKRIKIEGEPLPEPLFTLIRLYTPPKALDIALALGGTQSCVEILCRSNDVLMIANAKGREYVSLCCLPWVVEYSIYALLSTGLSHPNKILSGEYCDELKY